MSDLWVTNIRKCFEETVREKKPNLYDEAQNADPAFHTLDPKCDEKLYSPAVEQPCRERCCQKNRTKSKAELEQQKIIEEIFTKNMFVPRKIEVPFSHFEGAGIDPYKYKDSHNLFKNKSERQKIDSSTRVDKLFQKNSNISHQPNRGSPSLDATKKVSGKNKTTSASQKKIIKGKPYVLTFGSSISSESGVQEATATADNSFENSTTESTKTIDQNAGSSSIERKFTKGKPFTIPTRSTRKSVKRAEVTGNVAHDIKSSDCAVE